MRTLTFLLITLFLAGGCSSWRTIDGPLEELDPSRFLRVTLDDGQTTVLKGVRVQGDTLRGTFDKKERTIPLRRVTRIETSKKTGVGWASTLVVGIGVIGAAAAALIFERVCCG